MAYCCYSVSKIEVESNTIIIPDKGVLMDFHNEKSDNPEKSVIRKIFTIVALIFNIAVALYLAFAFLVEKRPITDARDYFTLFVILFNIVIIVYFIVHFFKSRRK